MCSGRNDAERLDDNSEIDESFAAVLLGRRYGRHLRVVLHTIAVDLTQKYLLLLGFKVAGGVLQGAVLHRSLSTDQCRGAAQQYVPLHQKGRRGRVHDSLGSVDNGATPVHLTEASVDISRW